MFCRNCGNPMDPNAAVCVKCGVPVGSGVNFCCGTITSNYDGFKKHRTVIGDSVFIGCNTNLIPPVAVGSGAYIAAGTTVTKDVEADALAIGRVRQEVKPDWAARRRQLHEDK